MMGAGNDAMYAELCEVCFFFQCWLLAFVTFIMLIPSNEQSLLENLFFFWEKLRCKPDCLIFMNFKLMAKSY